jgi:hypothetical protein
MAAPPIPSATTTGPETYNKLAEINKGHQKNVRWPIYLTVIKNTRRGCHPWQTDREEQGSVAVSMKVRPK